MRFTFILILVAGCISANLSCSQSRTGFSFKSGFFSGVEYILITKKSNSKKNYEIAIDCNHYISRKIGKSLFLKKYIYSQSGKYLSTWHLMKDSIMFTEMNNHVFPPNEFIPLSEEEYDAIKKAFLKYPVLTKKYNLDADKLKSYLGWYEIKK